MKRRTYGIVIASDSEAVLRLLQIRDCFTLHFSRWQMFVLER